MALDRYLKAEDGFRKYVELLESTPTAKRKAFLNAASAENALFAQTAEKYVLTFDRITKLPDMELTEVLGSPELKPEVIAIAIASCEDAGIKERLLSQTPRNLAPRVAQAMKDKPNPDPYDVGGARLKMILAARNLEKNGKLESVQIPKFSRDHFTKKAA